MADEPNGTSNGEEPDDMYGVLPPVPEHIDRTPPTPSQDINEVITAAEKEESRFQFSIAEMLLLVGAVALFLGILGCFPPEYAAGLAGLGALASMLVLILLKPTQPIIRLGWWIVLVIYALMVATKILKDN
jgi:hypothetical protein